MQNKLAYIWLSLFLLLGIVIASIKLSNVKRISHHTAEENSTSLRQKRLAKFVNETTVKKLRADIERLQTKLSTGEVYELVLQKNCTKLDDRIREVFALRPLYFEDPPSEFTKFSSYEVENCCCCTLKGKPPHLLKGFGSTFPNCIQCCDVKLYEYRTLYGLVDKLSVTAVKTILG